MTGYKYGDGFAVKPVAELLPGEPMIVWCQDEATAVDYVDMGGAEVSRAHHKARFRAEAWMSEPDRASAVAVVDLRDQWHRENM